MSYRGLFSFKQFWGLQIDQPERIYPILVERFTELRISKVILQSRSVTGQTDGLSSTINIFVQYEDDDLEYQTLRRAMPKVIQCLVCSLNTTSKREADLDLNFLAGKKAALYFTFEDGLDEPLYLQCDEILNFSGYLVTIPELASD